MSTPNIKLIIREGGPGLFFIYSTRSGREIIFKREDSAKVAYIPLSEWRARNYALAIDLLEQHLHPPIIFDFSDVEAPEAQVPPPGKDERDEIIKGLEETIAAQAQENEQLRNALANAPQPEPSEDLAKPSDPKEPAETTPQDSTEPPAPPRILRKKQQPQETTPDLVPTE